MNARSVSTSETPCSRLNHRLTCRGEGKGNRPTANTATGGAGSVIQVITCLSPTSRFLLSRLPDMFGTECGSPHFAHRGGKDAELIAVFCNGSAGNGQTLFRKKLLNSGVTEGSSRIFLINERANSGFDGRAGKALLTFTRRERHREKNRVAAPQWRVQRTVSSPDVFLWLE